MSPCERLLHGRYIRAEGQAYQTQQRELERELEEKRKQQRKLEAEWQAKKKLCASSLSRKRDIDPHRLLANARYVSIYLLRFGASIAPYMPVAPA